ncbi:MAG: hypothetical protein IID37_05325, partial [Planctomycetes bacterium]|nr:hypothetical protein [Planctomycetota bacterium]
MFRNAPVSGAIRKPAMPSHPRPGESLLVFLAGISLACFVAGGCGRETDASRQPGSVTGESRVGRTAGSQEVSKTTGGVKRSRPPFVDVTAQVGLAFHHVTGATGEVYFP